MGRGDTSSRGPTSVADASGRSDDCSGNGISVCFLRPGNSLILPRFEPPSTTGRELKCLPHYGLLRPKPKRPKSDGFTIMVKTTSQKLARISILFDVA